MSFPVHTHRSRWELWLAGISLLALYGCASSGSGGGQYDGGTDADAGTGGASSSGSGGAGVSGSGGSTGTNGSGGFLGSGGSTSAGSGGRSSASGGATGSGGSSAGGASGGGTPHCFTSIRVLSPTGTIEAGADATVQLEASANEAPTKTLTWTWSVSYDLGTTVPVTTSGNQGTIAEFPVAKMGNYQVTATPSGDTLCAAANYPVYVSNPPGPSFNFRTSASGYPTQDRPVKLSELPYALELQPGQSFTVKPINPLNGMLLDTYVRITSSNQVFSFEGNTSTKPLTTTLVGTQNYNVLIAPMESAYDSSGAGGATGAALFAPFLRSATPNSWSPQDFWVYPGTPVSARTVAADGAPLQGARMQLRSTTGTPSTVGASDSTGSLTMWARDGSMSALVAPPAGSGLPTATTASGAIGSTSDRPVSLIMQWAAVAHGTLTVQVQGVDAASPVPNAQVRLASAGMSYSAGTLTVQSPGADDVVLPTTASVTDSAVTGSDGRITFPPYPAGLYTLTIIPPAAAAPAAVTTVQVTLTAGAVAQMITLARKTPLAGTVTTPAGTAAAGAQVTAIDVGNQCTTGATGCPADAAATSAATGAVFSAQTDAGGHFSLSVDPDRTYQLIVRPPDATASTMGRAVRSAFRLCSTATAPCTSTNASGSAGTIPLPAGTQYLGVLTGNNSVRVGGASIQVFCSLASATCDPSVSLAETTSRGDGTFTVVLPVSPPSSALNN